MNEFDPESQFKEWKGDFSQSEEAREMAAWAAKVREQEEKDAWIAQRKAADRKVFLDKALRILTVALPLALVLVTLVLLGIPGFQAIRAGDAAEAGDYARAAGLYEWAGKWSLFDKIFEASKKAEENRTMQRLLNCSAGAADWEIPKSAVRLTGTSEGRSGPVTVEILADKDRIWRITVTEHSEDEEIGGQAARQLPERIYRAQSVDVDAVTGATITDPTSGLRMVNRKLISYFAENYPKDYPEPESTVAALKNGCKVVETPVIMRSRHGGKSSINLNRSVYYMIKVSMAIIVEGQRKHAGL